MASRKLLLVAAIILTILAADVFAATIFTKREAPASDSDDSVEYCYSAPCGWAVYKKLTRVVDFFMRNTCQCFDDQKCIRVEDDISVSAYVYRCRRLPLSNKS